MLNLLDDLQMLFRRNAAPDDSGNRRLDQAPVNPGRVMVADQPADLAAEAAWRESFCCSKCRRRRTPMSLRFFGRKVFFSVVVLLILVVRDGAQPDRLSRLAERHSVSVRTLRRWRQWWRYRRVWRLFLCC